MDENLTRYLASVALGEAKRNPDGSLFGYATESRLRAMFNEIGVQGGLEGSRPDICWGAVQYLANTPTRIQGGFPSGIEDLIGALCRRADNLGNADIALERLNELLAPTYVYIVQDERGQIQFHYGCVYDPNNQMCTEADGHIRELERSLRILVRTVLEEKFGQSWERRSGVTEERLNKWKERRGSRTKDSLIDYSDFYDLRMMIEKNWELFAPCFQNVKRTHVFLSQVESFRNDLAHNRDISREQSMLCIGMSSDLLTMIKRSLRERTSL
jgi:hypothetical protein